MSHQLRKKVALGVITIWALLSGICISENFGYFQDSAENANQTVEQALTVPADRVVYASDELPGLSPSSASTMVLWMDSLQTARPDFPTSVILEYHGPPHGPRLFQLLSTYRI